MLKRICLAVAGFVLACSGIGAGPALAQPRSAPQLLPMPPATPAARDIPYPGVIRLAVDATDIERRIYRVRETLPVAKAGPMTLLYPQWMPGSHAPRGALYNFTGLTIRAGGKTIAWTRDIVDVFAFHIDAPRGVSELEIEAEYLTPTQTSEGGALMTPDMLRLQWYALTLYPAGYFTRQIMVEASVRLPPEWQFATALEPARAADGVQTFKPDSLEVVADSPMFAGRYARKIDLDPGGRSRVTLNVFADGPEFLETKPEVIEIHRELIRQMDKLYGARHYNHYDFLVSLSGQLGGSGLEHHRSSEDGMDAKYFTTWDTALIRRDLLAHEYNHSWDGKYRRPADLWTPDFSTPMRDSLLWVYEGQTQYYGNVVAARAGFLTKQQALDSLALTAATYDYRVGREWRPLQDTTNDPIIAARRAIPWRSWQRSEDYYSEGQLIWLDVDTLIRERSKGARSLDDFAKAFFGVNDGDWGDLVYKFEDVVATLNRVEPYDWAKFLRARLDAVDAPPPLGGLKRGGYQLVYRDTQTPFARDAETRARTVDLTYSLGVTLDNTGRFTAVQWDSPAFRAGLTSGTLVVAVNGRAYDADKLKAVVKATITPGPPIELLIRQGDVFRTVRLDYRGGLRYPRLERIAGTPALLDDILTKR